MGKTRPTPVFTAKTFEEALSQAEAIDQEVKTVGSKIEAFPKGPMGLTPDHVRRTPEYQKAKAEWDAVFKRLRAFNGWYTKNYKKELHAYRQRLREERLLSHRSADAAEPPQEG